ncbi:MAG: trypsin-like peptidase domain-containing protein [Pontiellaceae bacterium]|nr:trypsin-like peptidase domain-containing protein [Pontiellaceae bacterium]MBN2784071.1 trypsin-like peptidase domain-containing protein [Pontiellaceae bacterium]
MNIFSSSFIKVRGFILLAAALVIAAPIAFAEEKADDEAEEKQNTHEEIGKKFDFGVTDVADSLVLIKCQTANGPAAGSGFIAKMDGKSYIFTNQHVIMGSHKIEFFTVNGDEIKPTGVELALKRDIARLPIADRDNALNVCNEISMDMPIAVFGNSEGAGVATELYGEITGYGADLVEVSAEFVSGNSGSPVIDTNRNVIGIASYVRFSRPSRMTENTRFENLTRRFCYKLGNVKWVPVRWNKYNDKYGKDYLETVALAEEVFNVIGGLFDAPFNSISENHADSELRRWSSQHNRAVNNSGNQRTLEVGKSAEALAKYCERRARSIEMKLENRDLTEFLREEFESYKYSFEYAGEVIDYFNTKLPSY